MNGAEPLRARAWTIAALAVLCACLLAVVLPHLRESYWIDEIVTQEMAEKEHLGDLLVSTRAAMAAPPLCHLCMRALVPLGAAEWVGRLPSLLLALGTVLLTFAAGRRLGGTAMGLWAAVFAATSPLLLRYAGEARPYSHFIFFTAALIYLVVRLAQSPPAPLVKGGAMREALKVWPALLLVILGGLYSHFYFAFVLLPLGAMIPSAAAIGWKRAGAPPGARTWLTAAGAWIVLVALVVACYHPFWEFYQPRFKHLEAGGSKSQTPVEWTDLGPAYALKMVSPALAGYEQLTGKQSDAGVGGRTLTLAFAALLVYGAARLVRVHGRLGAGLVASLLFALVACGVFLVGRNFFHHRYFVFQVPFYALFAAAGMRGLLEHIPGKAGRHAVAVPAALLVAALVVVRVSAAERLWGPPTGFKFAGEVVKANYQSGDRVMILGPRTAFDESMFFSENIEPRYPLRREPFFSRVGYVPTDPSMLEWALSGPGRVWLLRAYYAPWPDSVLYAKQRFGLRAEARQCDVYVAERRPDEPRVLTMFHVKHSPLALPPAASAEMPLVVMDRLPLALSASGEAAESSRPELALDGNALNFHRDSERRWSSAPVWIEPGTHTLRAGSFVPRELHACADDEETIRAVTHPRRVAFGDGVEFLGYDLVPGERLAPGDTFTVTYYWRALRGMDDNLKLVLRFDALNPANHRAWVRLFNDHAGCYGLHPTSDWRPGELVVERYSMRIPESHPEGLCAIHVAVGVSGAIGTFDRRHSFEYYQYMPWNAQGEDMFTAGALEVSRDRAPVFRVAPPVQATTRELSPALALLSSTVDATTDEHGPALRLRLVWQCRSVMQRHYRYHLTFQDPGGHALPVLVRAPFYDLYPTYAWQPGETLRDEMVLPLKEPLPPQAEVSLQLATGEYDAKGRLEPGETLGEPVPLGPLVWSASP